MKKIILPIIITIISLVFPLQTLAHPVDTSTMIVYIGQDVGGEQLNEKHVEGALTFNWLQLSSLTGENKSPVDIYNKIGSYDSLLYEYLNKHIKVENNEKACKVELKRFVEVDVNIVINLGVRYQVNASCEEKIDRLKITNSAFSDQVLAQSNKIILYKDGKSISETSDGILSLGQKQNSENTNNIAPEKTNSNKIIEYFTSLLNQNNSWTIPLIFLVIFAMGMLHSLEGGHNKIILGSLVVDNKIDLRQSLIFTIIFTLTHMSDIILLSFGLLFLDSYIDLYKLIPNITLYTILILLAISGFSVVKEARHILIHRLGLDHEHDHNHEHHHDHGHEHKELDKKQGIGKMILIAFISGLAPCVTGWSIFMLLFSTGNINLVLPGMVFFGFGVFTVLGLYTLLLHKTKSLVLGKYSWISQYSTIISMSLVFISTLIQLIVILN
jgi:ABC-type nickel/cobalt efflux system permease component RcnA